MAENVWLTIVKLFYERHLYSLAVVKSTRRFRPPSYINSLWRPRKSSEIIRLSDLGVVIKGEGREYIEQYIGKWMRRREFLNVMMCALYRSYKSVKTVERMMSALEEFAEKPIEPRPGPRRPRNVMYELPYGYPRRYVEQHAKKVIELDEIAVYIFEKTIHVAPQWWSRLDATVVVPRGEISGVELTEEGFKTLEKLAEEIETVRTKKSDREVLEELKLAIALAKLLS
jgi:hypothetical protein